MDSVSDILKEKGGAVFTATRGTTVVQAVDDMCRHRVGALIVCEGSEPCGIFSERDLMSRVILARRDPATTKLEDVMTTDVAIIEPSTTIGQAMAAMTERRCRHLPVVENGRIAGLISIGDLVRWQSRNQEFELRMLNDYIAGRYPG